MNGITAILNDGHIIGFITNNYSFVGNNAYYWYKVIDLVNLKPSIRYSSFEGAKDDLVLHYKTNLWKTIPTYEVINE